MFDWRLWSSSSSSSPPCTMQHHHQHEELLSLVALQRQQPLQAQQQHRQLASNSSSSNAKNTIDLMDLTDFDVQLALTENLGIQIFEVTDIVTRWMNDAFRICLVNQLGSSNSDSDTTVGGNVTTGGDAGNDVDAVMDQYADFDTIILLERNYNNGSNRRRLQDTEETATTTTTTTDQEEPPAETTSDAKDAETVPTTADTRIGELYTAAFKGAALFVRQDGDLSVPDDTVLLCQRQAFLEDAVLLSRLQQSTEIGLGLSVIDVRAFVNPINLNGSNSNGNNNANNNNNQSTGFSSSTDDSLEVVIIVAIVIACVAFLFLIFAIFWAWRYDKRNRQAYLAHGSTHGSSQKQRKGPNSTFDAQDSPESKDNYPTAANRGHHVHSSYPSVIGGDSVFEGGVYPESVISEDIESSLSQYYNSSSAYATHRNNMHGGTGGNGNGHVIGSGRLQDAASVSSMESYGYSLDGYAPSLATPMPSDAVVTSSRVVQKQQPYSSMAYAAQAPLPTEPAVETAAPASSALNVSDFTDAMMDTLRGHDDKDQQGPKDEEDDDDDQPDDEQDESAMMDDGDDDDDDDEDDDNYVSLDNDISAVNTTLNSEDVATMITTRDDPPDDDDDDDESK